MFQTKHNVQMEPWIWIKMEDYHHLNHFPLLDMIDFYNEGNK